VFRIADDLAQSLSVSTPIPFTDRCHPSRFLGIALCHLRSIYPAYLRTICPKVV